MASTEAAEAACDRARFGILSARAGPGTGCDDDAMTARLAAFLRRLADRIDHAGAPKLMHWSFTFEARRGIVFRSDGKGCPLAYLGDASYSRAHDEADTAA